MIDVQPTTPPNLLLPTMLAHKPCAGPYQALLRHLHARMHTCTGHHAASSAQVGATHTPAPSMLKPQQVGCQSITAAMHMAGLIPRTNAHTCMLPSHDLKQGTLMPIAKLVIGHMIWH